MALASAVCDSAIGLRTSSNRISPGCGLGSRFVVVGDFDFVRIVLSPDKANPPPVVDSDRVLAAPITFQGFEAVRGRYTQVVTIAAVCSTTSASLFDHLVATHQESLGDGETDRFR